MTELGTGKDRVFSVGRQWVPFLWLYALLCCLNLTTSSLRLGIADAGTMFDVTKSLSTELSLDTDPCVEDTKGNACVRGVDGKHYSGYGILPSALAVPWYLAGATVGKILHKEPDLVAGVAVSLMNCFLAPLVPCLLALFLARLGYTLSVGLAVGVTLGVFTPWWYFSSKGFYSEPHFALGLMVAVYCLSRPEIRGGAWFAGLALGLAAGCRVFGLILAPILLWYGWAVLQRTGRQREFLPRLLQAGLALGVCLAGIGALNYIRFGSPLKTGYHLAFPTVGVLLGTPLHIGLPGVLWDGEVGLLWFAPTVFLLPLTVRRFFRESSAESVLCLFVVLANLLFFAKYIAWHGGWSCGPRLLAPTLPFLVMPLAALYRLLLSEEGAFQKGNRFAHLFVAMVLFVAFVVQMLTILVPVNRYYYLKYHAIIAKYPSPYRGVLLWHHVQALPELITATLSNRSSDLQRPTATSGIERINAEGDVRQNTELMQSPMAYLRALPNSINLLQLDIGWLKLGQFGVPAILGYLAIGILGLGTLVFAFLIGRTVLTSTDT